MTNEEIDYIIARDFFQWEIRKSPRKNRPDFFFNGQAAITKVPHFSTTMENAWKVVDLLQQRFASVEIFMARGMTNVIVTERFHDGKLKQKYQGYDKSASMAICQAVLHILRYEVSA